MPKGTFVVNDWGGAEKSGNLGVISEEKPAEDLLSTVSSIKYANLASSTEPEPEPAPETEIELATEGLGAAAVTGYLDIEDGFYPFVVLVNDASPDGNPEDLHSLCRVISNLLPHLADNLEKQPEVLPEKCLLDFFHAVYVRLDNQNLKRETCRISLQLAYKDSYGNTQCLAVSDGHDHPGMLLVQESAHSSLHPVPNVIKHVDSDAAISFRYARIQLKAGARLFALSSHSENILSELSEVSQGKAGSETVSEPFVMAEILYPELDGRTGLKAAIEETSAKASEVVVPVVSSNPIEEGESAGAATDVEVASEVAPDALTPRARTFSVNAGSSSFYSIDLFRFPETQKIITAAAALKTKSFDALTSEECREIETQLTVLKNCRSVLSSDGYSSAESYLAQLVSLAFETGYTRFIGQRSNYNASNFKLFKAVPKPTLDFARIFQAIQLVREVNTWFAANKNVISKTVKQYLQASLFQLAANLEFPYKMFTEDKFIDAVKQFNAAEPLSTVNPESLLKAYKGQDGVPSLADIVAALKDGADAEYNLLRPAKSSTGAAADTLEAAEVTASL